MVIKQGEQMLASDILDLTFFPIGTILTFSTAAWNATSAAFKEIWKICNEENNKTNSAIPDLTNKFLRGGTRSGSTGGSDSNTVSVPMVLPEHSHRHTHEDHKTHPAHTGKFNVRPGRWNGVDGVFSYGNQLDNDDGWDGWASQYEVNMNATHDAHSSHGYDETTAGDKDAKSTITVDTVPTYYTVIYIMKVK